MGDALCPLRRGLELGDSRGSRDRSRAQFVATMEAESEPVTLLVKSPNQRHRDLELSSDRSWNVGRLKAHLSRVYPERPVSGAPGSASQPASSSPPQGQPPTAPLRLACLGEWGGSGTVPPLSPPTSPASQQPSPSLSPLSDPAPAAAV